MMLLVLMVLMGVGGVVGRVLQTPPVASEGRAGGQALLAATEVGDVAAMQALLAAPVDVNARNVQGWTPLHVAAAGGNGVGVELG